MNCQNCGRLLRHIHGRNLFRCDNCGLTHSALIVRSDCLDEVEGFLLDLIESRYPIEALDLKRSRGPVSRCHG